MNKNSKGNMSNNHLLTLYEVQTILKETTKSSDFYVNLPYIL